MMDLPPIYQVDTYEPPESLGRLLADAAASVTHAIDAEAVELGISSAQWVILVRIASGQASTAAELCRCGRCDTGSMTRMLDRLERKGLVRRERCADDRRVVRLKLTEAGVALYPQLIPIAVRVLNRHLRGFSQDEVETFKGFLERMLVNGGAT